MKKVFLILLLIGSLYFSLYAVRIDVIKNPKPTCIEKQFVQLKLAKSVSFDVNDKVFLAEPYSLTVDVPGNVYIFDRRQITVFKFSPELKFLKSFGRAGQGPGEFDSRLGMPWNISWGRDGCLHVLDRGARKIIKFNSNGEYLKQVSIPQLQAGNPVADEMGNFYLPSTHNAAVDIYDKEGRLQKMLLEEKLYYRHLFVEPTAQFAQYGIFPGSDNTYVLLLDNLRMLIFLGNDAACYYFEENRLVKSFHLWPEKALQIYKKNLWEIKKSNLSGNLLFFLHVFIDSDNPSLFYTVFGLEPNRVSLYQFDITGALKNVYFVARENWRKIDFLAKKNGGFFAIGEESLEFYKEKIK